MVADVPTGIDYFQKWQDELQQMMLRSQKMFELAADGADTGVGLTARDVVWQRGRTQLYRYRPLAERTVATPVLMVHSLISKPYILDLYPGGSFIEFLLRRGFDVYLIDWGTPTDADRHLRLEDYVQKMIPTVVRRIAHDAPDGRVSVFGYCMGGLLSVIYATLHPRAPLAAVAWRRPPTSRRWDCSPCGPTAATSMWMRSSTGWATYQRR